MLWSHSEKVPGLNPYMAGLVCNEEGYKFPLCALCHEGELKWDLDGF